MSGSVVPIGLEGAKVRLLPGFAWWRALMTHGLAGRNSVAEDMVFDAARSIRSADLVAWFWRDEGGDMDWLDDFLCDPIVAGMIEDLIAPEEDEEVEPEIYYSRKDLAQFGSDVVERY
jgi:hypothetical protein